MSQGEAPDRHLARRFARLTALNIASNLTVPLVGLVDTGMLGHLPDLSALAGVALGTILFEYLYWSFGFLRMGTTGLSAQALGRGERPELYRVLYRGVSLGVAVGITLLLLQLPLRELGFALLSGESAVEAAGRDYFDARIWAAPATLANFAFLGWYLGREESGNALWMTVTGNLANIGLNYLFIIRLGLAARGAGLATMVAQYLTLALAVAIFLTRSDRVRVRLAEVVGREPMAELLRLNRDILIRTLCLMTSFAIFLNLSSILGTRTLAVNTILHRLLTFAAFLVDGAAFATESLAGILRGAGDGRALGRLLRLSLASGEAFAALFLLGLLAAPGVVYGLLTSHAAVVAEATRYGWWLLPVLALGAPAYIYDGLFLGLTAGRALRNSMLISTLVVFLPAAGVALAVGSNDLLWLSLVLFMAARAATLAVASRPLLGGAR